MLACEADGVWLVEKPLTDWQALAQRASLDGGGLGLKRIM
jgi:hypothetical protein